MGNFKAKIPCVIFVGHVPEWVRLTSYKGVQIVFFEKKKKRKNVELEKENLLPRFVF